MGTTDPAVQDAAEAAVEAQKIEDLTALVQALSITLSAFAGLASADEQKAAEGRRCVLAVTGLKHHPPRAFFFEITGLQIKLVDPFTQYNTYVEAPIDSVMRVLKHLWNGREDGFSSEWSRGQAKIRGAKSLHDGMQFNEGYKRAARGIKAYRALTA
jgi:hypothetical protein